MEQYFNHTANVAISYLVKGCVGWSKDSEWSLSSESVCKPSGLDSCQEGGELGVGGDQVSDGLGGVLHHNGGNNILVDSVVDRLWLNTEGAVDRLDTVNSMDSMVDRSNLNTCSHMVRGT